MNSAVAKENKTNKRILRWIDDHMVNVIRYQHHVLSFLEHSEEVRYSFAPINDMRRQFITMDIKVLFDILRDGFSRFIMERVQSNERTTVS